MIILMVYQPRKRLKAPVCSAGNVIGNLQEEALRQFPAFQTVLNAKSAALVMVMRMEGTGIVRTRTKR